MPDTRSILCFGDSLTWGWIPVEESSPTLRYPYHQRWTGAMAGELGDGYHIVEEGLSARTTSCDDPNDPRLNGSTYLPTALASHLPLDLVILMLGTNDTKSYGAEHDHDEVERRVALHAGLEIGAAVLVGALDRVVTNRGPSAEPFLDHLPAGAEIGFQHAAEALLARITLKRPPAGNLAMGV